MAGSSKLSLLNIVQPEIDLLFKNKMNKYKSQFGSNNKNLSGSLTEFSVLSSYFQFWFLGFCVQFSFLVTKNENPVCHMITLFSFLILKTKTKIMNGEKFTFSCY